MLCATDRANAVAWGDGSAVEKASFARIVSVLQPSLDILMSGAASVPTW